MKGFIYWASQLKVSAHLWRLIMSLSGRTWTWQWRLQRLRDDTMVLHGVFPCRISGCKRRGNTRDLIAFSL